jgi:hypothetical protein
MSKTDELTWDDISSANPKMKATITIEMAGNGSHAWSYILEWNYCDCVLVSTLPTVFITRYPFDTVEVQVGKVLLCREEIGSPSTREVTLVMFGTVVPDDTEEHHHYLLTKKCFE